MFPEKLCREADARLFSSNTCPQADTEKLLRIGRTVIHTCKSSMFLEKLCREPESRPD